MCVHIHTYAHQHIYIYTTKGRKGKEGRKEGKGKGRKGRKEGTKEGREEGRKGKNEKEGKGGAPRCLSKRHCHRRTLLCNSPRTAAHQQGDWMVPLHHFVFSFAMHTSLHFRPWASLLSSVSNLVARHFTLSPFLYFPFGAMTDGDDANEKFCHKMLRHG